MLRHTVIAFVFSMLPASALACGMYIPPENDKLLAEILEEIDAPKAPEVKPAEPAVVEVAQPVAPAETTPAQVEATPAPTVIAEVAVAPKS